MKEYKIDVAAFIDLLGWDAKKCTTRANDDVVPGLPNDQLGYILDLEDADASTVLTIAQDGTVYHDRKAGTIPHGQLYRKRLGRLTSGQGIDVLIDYATRVGFAELGDPSAWAAFDPAAPVIDNRDPFEPHAEEPLEPPDVLATIGDLARAQHELAELYGSCTFASGQTAGGDCWARVSTPTAHGASSSTSLVGALAGALAALRSKLPSGST